MVFVIGWLVLLQACDGSGGESGETLVLACHLAPGENCEHIPGMEHCLSKGVLDLNHTVFSEEPVYRLFPLFYNYVDGSAVQIEKYVVGYEWLTGRDILEEDSKDELLMLEDMEETVSTGGIVESASESGKPGSLLLEAISGRTGTLVRTLGEEYADSMVLGIHARVYGSTQTGIGVESNEIVLPIELCWGCLDVTCCSGEKTYYPSRTPGQDNNELLPCECPTD